MELPNTYITGMGQFGKTTLLHNFLMHDIYEGHGVFYIDTNGTDIDRIIDLIPDHRWEDVIYYDPTELPIAMNPFTNDIPPTAAMLADTTRSVAGYDALPTPNITNNVYFAVSALMAAGATLSDITRLLGDVYVDIPRPGKKPRSVLYRDTIMDSIDDTFHQDYWKQFNNLTGKERREFTSSTRSQFYILFGDPRIRQSFVHKKASFSFTEVVEENRIFLAKLPQGSLGVSQTKALASFLTAQLLIALLDRQRRSPFTVVLDDIENFSAPLSTRLSTIAGKYGARVIAANMFIHQLDKTLFAVLRGNFPARHVFRLSPEDAKVFKTDLGEMTAATDLDLLPRYLYRTFPFAEGDPDHTVAPPDYPKTGNRDRIESNMRRNYMKGGK